MAENGTHQTVFTPQNILITGGAGFIGSHVVLRLVNNYPHYKVNTATPCSPLAKLAQTANA